MHTWIVVLLFAQGTVAVAPELSARVQVNESVTLARAGRLMEALRAVDAAIVADPFLASAHHNRGVVLAMLGRHREALAAFDRAIQLDPKDSTARRARDLVLRRTPAVRVRTPKRPPANTPASAAPAA